MAHSLVCSGAAAFQATALLAPALESRHIATDTLQRSTAWGSSLENSQGQLLRGSQLAQRCSACARAEQGGQEAGRGRGRGRGRGKAASKGRGRGRSVRDREDSATGRSEGPRDPQPSTQPGTGADESESPDRGVVVLTAERQDAEESEDKASAGGENGHPAPESSASPEESSESGSGSESESEASLREDIERLEREATQRLLALQKQQKARAEGELRLGEEAEGKSEQEHKEALKEAPEEADTSEVKDDESPDEGSGPSVAIVEDVQSEETTPVESSPPEEEPPAAASSSEVPEVPPREEQREAQLRKLAKAHALDRMFFYPEKVTAGGVVEVFLNRGVSTLAGKSEIELLGSFNDWQYQQLGVPLRPNAELGEPWWSCTLGVPGEAYKLDFVFHSGEVYENNAGQDFFIAVEGGLDAASFAAWVGQQKREEQRRRLREKEAAQRAELERARQEEAVAQEARDREAAAAAAAAARSALSASLACAAPRVESVYFLEPEPIQAGSPVQLLYNRSYRPLCFAGEVWVHAGYNSWKEGVSTVKQLKPDKKVEEKGDWYSVELDIPADALVLNWVLADAPPERAQFYDNNELRDFHAPVGGPNKVEAYLDQLEEETYARIRAERKQQEEDRAARAARRAVLRQETAARTMAQFLAAQSHVLYTEPQPLQAGREAAVFYNPQATVLAGRQEVWMRGGFNRWSHRGGTWGPIKMEPTKDGSHLKATVALPADAYILDAVFSERGEGDGGLYDNKGGLDYHIPISGSTVQAPPLHIVHIALEMAPIAKVGGLGDVVTSLARAVEEAGHCVEVILPKYNNLDYSQVHFLEETESFQFGATTIRTWQGKVEGLLVRFIEPENGMFWVGTIYGRRDDGPRFEFFCHAALEYLRQTGQNPDILHCHDWSSAPVAWMYWEKYHSNGMPNPRVVFTIHNLEFGVAQIGRAMAAANKATTVSPTYAWEVSGHGAISPHVGKFHGIRNGIDADIWDPLGDDFLPLPYSSAEVVAGKAAAKAALQRRLGLVEDPSKPVVGFITRLTAQKGIHLIKHAIWRSLDRGAQVVLLGSAPDPRVHNEFQGLAGQLSARFGGMARLWLGYDEPLSHLIYAGSDVIVVPSLFEPCGLTQMVAMRYGAVPVVRKTGGLNDTVFDLDHDRERAQREGLQPNGYSFEGTDASAVDYAINRALDHWYNDRNSWNNLARTVMDQDWSWNRPALDYLELYYGARK